MKTIIRDIAVMILIAFLLGGMVSTIIGAQQCSKNHTLCERRG